MGAELQTNIDSMKDTLEKIGEICVGGMSCDEINGRILEIVKKVVDLKQQAEVWAPKLDDIALGWARASKWVSDSNDALGESGAITVTLENSQIRVDLDEINELIQRFSQLISQAPTNKSEFDDMRQLLSNINQLESEINQLLALLEQHLVKLMTLRDQEEVTQLFADCNSELDQARTILSEIREILRRDGPDKAKEAKRDLASNPIDTAKQLLDQVAEKFKQKPNKDQVQSLQKMHAELEKLQASEKQLEVEIDTLPGEIEDFNVSINEVSEWLNSASDFCSEKIKQLEQADDDEELSEISSKLTGLASSEDQTISRMKKLSEKLVSISENLPEDQKQEYEELLLATTSKCKSTLAQLKSGQEKVAQVAEVFALTEKLTSQIDLCEQIESENQDCDEAGICRTIDSITSSRKLRDITSEQLEKFRVVQRETKTILTQAGALVEDSSHLTPDWFAQRVTECETMIGQLEESLEQRQSFLNENLEAWIAFEETCDEVNSYLDQSENDSKLDFKPDTLQKVDYRLADLETNKRNMVSFIYIIFYIEKYCSEFFRLNRPAGFILQVASTTLIVFFHLRRA